MLPRFSFAQSLALLVILSSGGPLAALAEDGGFAHFVTRSGDSLMDGAAPIRFVSWNIPNLQSIEDDIKLGGGSPWRWPDAFEVADALESVRQMGGTVVRTYVLSVAREGADFGDHVHVRGPGEFNEEAFEALDRVLAQAPKSGVRIMIPLVDNWKWMGGAEQYAAFRGKTGQEFWTDPQLIADFKRTIEFVVNRRNTLTGKLYRDDPALFGWETGNEIDAPPAWTREIAAYIKSLDPNHLVIDGVSLHGVPTASLDDPHVDVVTTHHYPGPGVEILGDVKRAIAAAAGKKPYFVGEVGFVPNSEIAAVIDTVKTSQAAGVLLWSLRFHRSAGGFYWHSEPAVGGRYKAFHWPGFDSGRGYDERELMALVRNQAFAIRGMSPPAAEAPAPPVLFPSADSSHQGGEAAVLSWRGSAGASGYKIERASSPAGPWETIATEVDDARWPYQPLFVDSAAPLGEQSFYRCTAHNQAGASAPSNTIGPITPSQRLIVDELDSIDGVASTEGEVTLRTDNCRAVLEDRSRAALGPGGSLAWQVDGAVSGVHAWAYTAGETDSLRLEVSEDGEDWRPLEAQVRSGPEGQGDYGYRRPVELHGAPDTKGKWLRMVSSVEPGADVDAWPQLGRIELRVAVGE